MRKTRPVVGSVRDTSKSDCNFPHFLFIIAHLMADVRGNPMRRRSGLGKAVRQAIGGSINVTNRGTIGFDRDPDLMRSAMRRHPDDPAHVLRSVKVSKQ
jgi:hypothetical protein